MPLSDAVVDRPASGGRFLFLLLVLFAPLLLGGCETAGQASRLNQFFDELVFGPGGSYEGRSSRVVKWTGPVRYRIHGVRTAEHGPKVREAMARFSALTGLSIEESADETENFVLTFVEEEDFAINASSSRKEYVPCAAGFDSGKDGIEQASVRISTADDELADNCIVHELLHAFGFRHHSALVRSALSPFYEDSELTLWDEMALSVLYDPAIANGARREEVLPIAERLIAAFLARH